MERPFRFAVFVNGAYPLHCFAMKDAQVVKDIVVDSAPMTEQAENMFLRPSVLRKKDGVSNQDQIDRAQLLSLLKKLKGKKLVDGTTFLSSGTNGFCRWELPADGAPLIDLPTLHIRSTESDESGPHEGLHSLRLCDPGQARELNLGSRHDFPEVAYQGRICRMHNPKTSWVEVELVLPRVFELDTKQHKKLRDQTDDLPLGRIPSRTHAHTSIKYAITFTPLLDYGILTCPPFCVNLVCSREHVAMVEQRSGHEDHTALPYDKPFQLCVFHDYT
ncbi:hypothetical protein LTR49_028279 [Elasticomyces elasticus]|nr:hypothetical protein LTR49_028279 [Elasticomyces elasticus]